jgi:hypothetical protein
MIYGFTKMKTTYPFLYENLETDKITMSTSWAHLLLPLKGAHVYQRSLSGVIAPLLSLEISVANY